MTFADVLGNQDVPKEWQAHSTFDGERGEVVTGPIVGAPLTDFSEILRQFGYDPELVEIVGKVNQWKKERPDGQWLTSYFFGVQSKRDHIDLPALYAEVKRTKHRPVKVAAAETTTVVCWADVQTGKVDHLGDTAALLHRLEEKRVALEGYLRRAKSAEIVICDVGDIVEGFENVSSQQRTNDLSLMDQLDIASTELWKTIKTAAKYAPVRMYSIPSNHAQWRSGKGLVGKPTDDWGLYINAQLERLNSEARLPVTFHRPDDWNETLTFDVRGTILGLAHGHQANSPDRVPLWWAKMAHAGVMECDVLLTGHFHFPSIRPSGKNARTKRSQWHLQAPTLDNGSAWVRNKMGEDGDPGLMVFQITDQGFDLQSLSVL